MARGYLREEEIESRWEAAPAVGLVITFQLVLALVSREKDWKLSGLPWWVWLVCIVPEVHFSSRSPGSGRVTGSNSSANGVWSLSRCSA